MKFFSILVLLWITTVGGRAAEGSAYDGATLLATKGRVDISKAGSRIWSPPQTNAVLKAGDQLRTLENSRATLRLRDATVVNVNELTTLRVAAESGRSVIELLRGVLSFFHRDQPGDAEVRGGAASAIIRGTEFTATLDDSTNFTILLFEGSVEVTNSLGRTVAMSGDSVTASPNIAPQKSPGLAGTNRAAIQWILYYPSVLDPRDVQLSDQWEPVLKLYREGNLWGAVEAAKSIRTATNDSERLFRSALRLAIGDVDGMREVAGEITSGSKESRIASALENVVHAVQFTSDRTSNLSDGATATEILAQSFFLQSGGRLSDALLLAKKAVAVSPEFGFAHARVAELEFGSGNIYAARVALKEALRLSPRLASAIALDGFILAAEGKFIAARDRFDEAIEVDSGLGDAWLGRGLIRFSQRDRNAGRIDMETAAALEPQRSVLRSYLGKAFAEEGSDTRALAELAVAEQLDQKDPTALLYSALIRYRQYDLGGAIRDLEESAARNQNRAVFRSQMLLDQDAAVRSAKLANIYEIADMSDVARRESAQAVTFDYANFSAHLNLASSFNALRDPTRFNLRNETVWFNEHLLASLLAPTDSAPLSQNLSQNEYSRLFARDHVGFSTTAEFFSNREVRYTASQFGNFQNFSYALDLDSDWLDLRRTNQTLSRIEWYSRFKFALTPADSLLLLLKYEDYVSGDNFQYADQTQARPAFHFQEQQLPIVLAGYHHEWGPGSHTLLLGGRLQNEQRISDLASPQLIAFTFPPLDPATGPFNVSYRNDFVIYSAEANQILESESHTTIFGGRYQRGDFDANVTLDDAPVSPGAFGGQNQTVGDGDFQRASIYLYHTWEIISDLRLTAGVSYDDVSAPINFRRPPLQSGQTHRNAWSPKAALVYNVSREVTLRGVYAESLGGVSYDESVTLEPTQLAGFPQSYRTIISESLVGSVEMPRHDIGGLAVDLKFPSRTYISAEGVVLDSSINRASGLFSFDASLAQPGQPAITPERIRYHEHGARLTGSQIIASEWFANATYQFTRAELDRSYPAIPATAAFNRNIRDESYLHRLALSLLYQRKDGWFGRVAMTWLHQESINPAAPPSDEFAQLHMFLGYRLPRLHGDITLGVLNVTDSDYHLHTLTPYEEFPRERTFYLRFHLNL